jgi:polyisoprenoid-binding protein YceI
MLSFVLLFLFSSGANAANWKVNKDHSQIFFKTKYLTLSEVIGQFKEYDVELNIEEDSTIKELSIEINVSSIDTGHTQRDGHLKAHDFLYQKKYPKIFFKMEKAHVINKSSQRISGLLMIKKISRPVTIHLEFSNPIKDSWGHVSRFVKFESQIKRSDFGLDWNKTLANSQYLVGDEVVFWGTFQIQPTNDFTATSKHMIPDTPSIRLREKMKRGEVTDQEIAQQKNTVLDQSHETNNEVAPTAVLNDTEEASDSRQRLSWQFSLWGLGALGFLASIILGFFGKKMVIDFFDKSYEEDSWHGHLSDLITIGFTALFGLLFWLVGWG